MPSKIARLAWEGAGATEALSAQIDTQPPNTLNYFKLLIFLAVTKTVRLETFYEFRIHLAFNVGTDKSHRQFWSQQKSSVLFSKQGKLTFCSRLL